MPRTFVDRGGTFTDVVTWTDDGRVEVRKVPSDRAVIGDLARGGLTFGTTVATNALLERTGVPTLLIVNEGFADLVHIGDGSRPSLFEPESVWPEPLCGPIVEIAGRLDQSGHEIQPLGPLPPLPLDEVQAVAVVLMHSGVNPIHELHIAERLAELAPHLHVALGHQVSPEVGYLGRIETTLVEASITPVLRAAIRRDRVGPDSLAMQSDGGLCPGPDLSAPDAVLSGPAGGVVAVAEVARQAGFSRAVGLDMGGTSTDVCRVESGHLPRREGEVRVAGVRLRRPMLEVDTIAAGGGSICWTDGLRLGVGPRSAGANPGPQCYGRGGPPTLTDAALQAGLMNPSAFDPPLDPSLVDLPTDPHAFLAIAQDAMAAAIRTLATRRGVDLRDHALVAFGGAAGQHAAAVAERLQIATVLCHPCAGVLSAWGQAMARRQATASAPIWRPLDEAWPTVASVWQRLAEDLPNLEERLPSLTLRHQGTDHALEVVASSEAEAREAFKAIHRKRYGFDREGVIELVDARMTVRSPAPPDPPRLPDPFGLTGTVLGPTTLHAPTTSVHVPRGWTARWVDGLLRLDRSNAPKPVSPTERTPLGVALWGARFMSVAEQAGALLQRLARSVNIRERLDFSCAVFDGQGRLVANAPHIPVHLGAMGATIRDLLRTHPDPQPGQAWLCNDPGAGGSHLPDLTVMTAIDLDGHRFFAASRAHHVDVGGRTPGSMPPHSSTLAEEGMCWRHVPLLDGDRLRDDLDEVLAGCRQPSIVRADLEAQIAANAHAARLLSDLGEPEWISVWMAHLQDVAAQAVERAIQSLPSRSVAEDLLDGLPLRLTLTRDHNQLHVDLAGTGGPHAGNLNAPGAVVRAAVLYGLRVLIDADIPLNEGALRPVRITLPEPSLVSPPPGAAVAGGNVETSQRLVDLFLRAAGRMAGSAGTMSNLTLGGEGWSLYETIAAGQGASPRSPGRHCRQVHMTNTRATDPEVMEHRLPLRLHAFQRRRGSGGAGPHPGGDGTVREIELIRGGTAALLATRRGRGAPGLGTGQPGRPGEDAVRRSGAWEPWSGTPLRLEPGDRVRVATPGGGGSFARDDTAPSPHDDSSL